MDQLKKLFKKGPSREVIYNGNDGKSRRFKRFWKSKRPKKNYEERFQKILLDTKGESIVKQCDGDFSNKELMLDQCSTEIISDVLNDIIFENSEAESISSLDCRSSEAIDGIHQNPEENQEELGEQTPIDCENVMEITKLSTCGTSAQSFVTSQCLKNDEPRENIKLHNQSEELKSDNRLKNVSDLKETGFEDSDDPEDVVRNKETDALNELSDSKLFSSLFDEGFDKIIIKKLVDRRNLLANAISIVAKSDNQCRYFLVTGQGQNNDIDKDKRKVTRKNESSKELEKYSEEEQNMTKEIAQLEEDMEPSGSNPETQPGVYISSVDMFLMRNLKKFVTSKTLTTALKHYNKDKSSKEANTQVSDPNIKQENQQQDEDPMVGVSLPTDVEAKSASDKKEEDSRKILLEKRVKELREDIIILKKKIAEEMKRNVEVAAQIKQATNRLKRPNEFYGGTRNYEHGALGFDNVDWAALKRDYMRAKRIKAAVDFIFTLGQMEEECLTIQKNMTYARNNLPVPPKF